ncbi:AMP-binding protein [Bordetella sp. N]|uniref:ApeI family dehydratase n=1 Tax=Bordetella sp. N TaxID=1746199 RepID=UPI001E4BA891|nr:AMP-binding protein [Bordetella sp. N]
MDLDSGAVVLCTSGSSGQPKQIRKRWRQLAAEIEALEALWHWSKPLAGSAGESLRPVCVLGSVSPQHMYGLPFRLLWPLCSGRLVARRQLVYPEALQHASLPHADFVWIASPALLKRLGTSLDHAALRGGLRQIVSSGGPLPGEISDMLARDLGCRPCEIYGSSETGAVAWRQGDTAWQPLPGAEVGVPAGIDGAAAADAAGNPPPQTLWIRSPWLMPGETFQSNDAVQLTADGFRLLGRMDRIVKIEEKRIALPAVEQALALHPYVNEARVDLVAGEQRLSALIALTAQGIHALRNGGRAALAQALRAHLAPTQEALAVPRHLRFVRELPWNAQGKLSRADFERALARPRWPREIASAPTQDAGCTVEPALPAHASRVPSATTTGVESVDAPPEARRYQLEIPLDLRQFDGHFATTPVVPGVAQIDWAMNLARRDLSTELTFCGADALKFQRLIRPGDQIDLALRWEPAKGRLYFEFRAGDQPCSSGRILTQARHDPA